MKYMSHKEARERRKRMMEDLKAGMTHAEVARKYDVSLSLVYSIRLQGGLPTYQNREPTRVQARSFKILRDILAGKPIGVIAKEHDMSEAGIQRVRNMAREAGFELPDGRRKEA